MTARFIRLHDDEGDDVLVNVDKIIYVEVDDFAEDGRSSTITFTDDEDLDIEESIEEIWLRIEEATGPLEGI